MKCAFKEHERSFVGWCKAVYPVALSGPQKLKVKEFLKNIVEPKSLRQIDGKARVIDKRPG